MRDFGTKRDNDETSAGVVVADEYNSMFNEAKGAVQHFLPLNELDNSQLAKSIDIASKAMFYDDIGSPNVVHLIRGVTAKQFETLFDGMVVFFSPANANTGASTLKVNGVTAKEIKFNGGALQAGMLQIGVKYMGIYRSIDSAFHIDVLTNNKMPGDLVDKNYVDARVNGLNINRAYVDGRFNGLKILKKIIYKNNAVSEEAAVNTTASVQTSIAVSYTPVNPASKIIVECSGSFRASGSTFANRGMDIQLRDNGSMLQPSFGMFTVNNTKNTHQKPSMVHVDERGGVATRNYQVWIKDHGGASTVAYSPNHGKATIAITEVLG